MILAFWTEDLHTSQSIQGYNCNLSNINLSTSSPAAWGGSAVKHRHTAGFVWWSCTALYLRETLPVSASGEVAQTVQRNDQSSLLTCFSVCVGLKVCGGVRVVRLPAPAGSSDWSSMCVSYELLHLCHPGPPPNTHPPSHPHTQASRCPQWHLDLKSLNHWPQNRIQKSRNILFLILRLSGSHLHKGCSIFYWPIHYSFIH